jgi:hypothetical protein
MLSKNDQAFKRVYYCVPAATVIGYTPTNSQRVQVNSTAFLYCDSTFNPTLDLTYDWWHNNYHIEFERLRVGPGNVAYFEFDEHYSRVRICCLFS